MLLPPCCALYAALTWANAAAPAPPHTPPAAESPSRATAPPPALRPSPPPSRLAHFMARTLVAPASPQRISLTVDRPSSQRVFVRALGRGLPDIMFPNTLPTPVLSVHAGARVVAEDRGSAIAPEFAALAHAAGAFPASRAGRPRFANPGAALAPALERGALTCVTSSGDLGAGVVLVECHELPAAGPPVRVRHFSLRGHTGPGDAVMVLGFVILGEAPLRLLVRALGPALDADSAFPAPALADPRLEVHRAGASTPLAQNDNWTPTPTLLEDTRRAHAAALPAASRDAALVVALAPGVYTVQLSALGAGGIAQLELHVLD